MKDTINRHTMQLHPLPVLIYPSWHMRDPTSDIFSQYTPVWSFRSAGENLQDPCHNQCIVLYGEPQSSRQQADDWIAHHAPVPSERGDFYIAHAGDRYGDTQSLDLWGNDWNAMRDKRSVLKKKTDHYVWRPVFNRLRQFFR